MRILIVDNDKNTAETLKAALDDRPDLQVEIAYGGEEALKLMSSGEPCGLILLDIMMPGVSGIEVCKRMAKEERTKNIPVILISALPIESGDFRESLGGFNELRSVKGVLEKPFTLSKLGERIDAVIGAR